MGSDVVDVATETRAHPRARLASGDRLDVSFVIVSYNSRAELTECLPSIAGQGSRFSFETIVVDNASSDGTAAFVREGYPWVRLFENEANVGYSRAVNRGVRESRGRYILVLNPDVVVLQGTIDCLAGFMNEHPNAGIVGPRLENSDGTLQHSCRRFYTFWTLVLRRTFLGRVLKRSRALASYLMLDFDHATSREVDWVIGAAMMVRRAALTDIGLMDERFFLYFEDVDWCYRTWRSGWKVYYVPDAVMRHRYARESARPIVSRQFLAHAVSLFHFYDKWGKVVFAVRKYRGIIRTSLLVISDLAAVNAAFALAYALRSSLRGLLEKPMFGAHYYVPFLVFANIVFAFSFAFFGLYGRRAEREGGPELLLRATKASFVAAVILMAATFLTSQTVYSRVLVGTFSVLAVVLATLFRDGLRRMHRVVRAGRFDLTRAVIVGTGPLAERIAGRMLAHEELGYDLAGLIETGDAERTAASYPVIGKLRDLPRLIEEQRIGEVLFADPGISNEQVADLLLKARRSAVEVKMVSGLTGLLTQRARVEEFLDLPVVSFEREALLRAGAGVKRALDVVSAAGLIVLWSPFLGVAAITLAARGGPLVTELRAGLEGVPYRQFMLRPAVRESALRRFVRRHGLDGFPALLNVMRGEMSLVGPDPVTPEIAERLDARARIRFDARPGMTGLARVSSGGKALRGDDPVALDVYYVQNWTLGGDLAIVLKWLERCFSARAAV
jgi:GT2 family glycosyltransferase/lipopolysaccharide/colanic/teichoic acid biosynthesis glycosyltransferase